MVLDDYLEEIKDESQNVQAGIHKNKNDPTANKSFLGKGVE